MQFRSELVAMAEEKSPVFQGRGSSLPLLWT
jgi:hypothetical protein